MPEQTTYRVKFKSGGQFPSRFLMEKARKEEVPHGKTTTMKVLPAKYLSDGETADVAKDLRDWLCNSYPDNFSEVAVRGKKESDV